MILTSIPGIRLIKLQNPTISYLMPVLFLDENIADNFATMYGFGPELNTALAKIDMYLTPIKKIEYETPVIGWLAAILDVASEFVMQLFDEHPTVPSRRKEQYNYLLRELDKADANPRLKREIEDEIARMEDAIHEIETDYGRFGGKLVAAKMNMLLDKLKHGDDIRSYIVNSKTYGHIYDRPEYENESAVVTTGNRTGVFESYINILNTKMI